MLVLSDAYRAVGLAIGWIYGVLKAGVQTEGTVAYVRHQVRLLALLIRRLLGNKARAYGPPLLNNLIPLLAPVYVIADVHYSNDYSTSPKKYENRCQN